MLASEALAAWQERDRFVEELKNDYVVAYFWVRYNNYTRGFNQTRRLEELLKVLNSQ